MIAGEYIDRLFALIPELSCEQIASQLRKAGFQTSKSTIERLKKKERDLKLEELLTFAKVFQFEPEWIFKTEEKNNGKITLNFENFIVDPEEKEFQGYLGKYSCWFYSTAKEEEGRLIRGTLRLQKTTEAAQKVCEASVLLSLDKENTKKFVGRAVISRMQAIWILLTDEAGKGDFVVIVLRYRSFNSDCKCRLGGVLTIGAGEHKQPVFEKIILTRGDMDEEQVVGMLPFMKMGLPQLYIPVDKWKKWSEKYKECTEFVPATYQDTYLINLYSIIEEARIPMEGIYELLRDSESAVLQRLSEVEDRTAFRILNYGIRRGQQEYD